MRTIFTVTENIHRNGYKISIGTGKTFTANNLKEVSIALKHYFEMGCARNEKNRKNCPFCKE